MDFEGKVKEINSRARGLIGLINKYLDTQDYSLLPIINSEAHEIAQLKWDDTSPLKGEPVEPAPGRFNECQRSLPTSHQCIDCMVADRCDDPNAEAIGKSIRLKSLNPERVSEPAPEKIRDEAAKLVKATWTDGGIGAKATADAIHSLYAPLLAEAEQTGYKDGKDKGRREVIELAGKCLDIAGHGDYSNGNVSQGMDEGDFLADRLLRELRNKWQVIKEGK